MLGHSLYQGTGKIETQGVDDPSKTHFFAGLIEAMGQDHMR